MRCTASGTRVWSICFLGKTERVDHLALGLGELDHLGELDRGTAVIPEQFLVIRDVKIQASQADWGGDGQTLKQMYADLSLENRALKDVIAKKL